MTPAIRHIIRRLEKLGYPVMSYHNGTFYVARLGVRDLEWATRVIRRAGA
jgi:hypothetical protein